MKITEEMNEVVMNEILAKAGVESANTVSDIIDRIDELKRKGVRVLVVVETDNFLTVRGYLGLYGALSLMKTDVFKTAMKISGILDRVNGGEKNG